MNVWSAWRRRGLPTGPRGLKCCQASYSQFGEDVIVDAIFGPSYPRGRYVDIGCFDPQKWSNTYRFYQKGWGGICVDPNEAYESVWRSQRPRDVFVRVAVADETGQASYIVNPESPQENRIGGPDRVRDGEMLGPNIQTASLYSILCQYHPIEIPIDLMSVDCEGHDLFVLESNDYEQYRPRVLVVEDHSRLRYSKIDQFCEAVGYCLKGFTVVSKIYCDSNWLSLRQERTAG